MKDGVFSINEKEAETVRFIYAEALSGKSSSIIARGLNERGVPARRGAHWTPTAIRNVLTNEKYVGDCLFQKTYSDFTFKRRTNYGEMDQFYMENHHEALVSREDFETVGQLIRQRAREKNIVKGTGKYQNRYAFTSRIICGECGSVFKRRINSTGRIKYPAWVCKEHNEHVENCSMKFIREDAIEWTFVLMMNKLIFAREKILQDLQRNIRQETHKEIFRRVDEIDTALEKNREKGETLTTIMTKGYIEPAMFTQEMNDLSAEADALINEREQLALSVDGDVKKAEALNEIIRFTGRTERLTEYDPGVFSAFVEQIIGIKKASCGDASAVCRRKRVGLTARPGQFGRRIFRRWW